MSFFPICCVDNFYNNPDSIREFCSKFEYKKVPGIYPGLRTDPLQEIAPGFFHSFCLKLLSLFYDYNDHNVKWNIGSYFQKITPFSKNPDDPINTGWVHLDKKCVFAGVIYLNPNPNKNAGTSIYQFKNSISKTEDDLDFSIRDKFYSGENIDIDLYKKTLIEHNDQFEKVIEFKNVYNRMISYDGWHKENNFYINENEPRLTQVFFVEEIEARTAPIERIMMSGI